MTAPRVVIIGNGMAGTRLAEDIRRRDPHAMLAVTVIGDEVHEAYNRVLLSEVLAGRHVLDDIWLGSPGWAKRYCVDVRLGDPVIGIDRDNRVVTTQGAAAIGYDVAVFATGSEPCVPDVAGLRRDDGALIPGAFFLRTIDDCRELLAASASAHRVVVLGGGLLGIEAARALAARGAQVMVVHGANHLLNRQLDIPAGGVLGRALADLDIGVRLDACASRVIVDGAGHVGGIEMADGSYAVADLLLVAAGTNPRVALARDCGLAVERGILTDDTMRCVDDRRMFAIGDCAQFDGRVHGVVAAAWEQARVAADQITGANPGSRYRGSRAITRLKAQDITVASMGMTEVADADDEVVMVTDTAKGAYRKLIVRHGRLRGAIVVGELDGVGTICQLFERDALLPSDRLSLLTQQQAPVTVSNSPALMPSATTVCSCNGVTKSVIQRAVLGGARTVPAVAAQTRATTGCGGCRDVVAGLVDWLNAADAGEVSTGADAGEVSTATAAYPSSGPARNRSADRTPVEAL